MNSTATDSTARPPMSRWAKAGLWLGVFVLLGVMGLWLAHERAKGRAAAFKAELIARGENLEFAQLIPPMPPAESNGAPAFLRIASSLSSHGPELLVGHLETIGPGRAHILWQQDILPGIWGTNVFPEVAAFVESNRDVLDQLRLELEKPWLSFDRAYQTNFLAVAPHLTRLKSAAGALKTACAYDFHIGRTADAFGHLRSAVFLSQRYDGATLLDQLVRNALCSIAIPTTWAAVTSRKSDEKQLAALQAQWEATDLLNPLIRALEIEQVQTIALISHLRQRPAEVFDYRDPTSPAAKSGFGEFLDHALNDPPKAKADLVFWSQCLRWPFWTSYEDEVWSLRARDDLLQTSRQLLKSTPSIRIRARLTADSARRGPPPDSFISSRVNVDVDASVVSSVARHECLRQLAIVAIALERYRLRHGVYAKELLSLVPEFLSVVPLDFVDGQPLRYRLTPDGQFLLWSVGEDGKDDGGDGTSSRGWEHGRDIVWPQLATRKEVEAFQAAQRAKAKK